VSANEAELNPLDNTSTMTTTVQVLADLLVSSAISGPTSAGGMSSYTLIVTNIGPSNASEVVLTDSLPMGTRLVSAVSSHRPGCRIEQDHPSANTGVCGLGNLSGGETATVTITVAVDESLILPLAEPLVHSVRVTAEQPDPDLRNNALTESIPVSVDIEN
jgi:uncharacterized repeat protein (TIGR01451 family)